MIYDAYLDVSDGVSCVRCGCVSGNTSYSCSVERTTDTTVS